eukprot:TRINITY_DN1298_c0_g1_i1.p1 TRINITY_DN1298_c0_g1~~TRINITY_DN1298_c0_g1_i1.p1  ORF type:complete len:221 (+),score=49.76 TRINITY_DN1298_c0_g1_i1:76-738(+)
MRTVRNVAFASTFLGCACSALKIADNGADKETAGVLQGLQATLLLSAMLPKHDVQVPSKKAADQMSRAGEKLYGAYALLHSAAQDFEETAERLSVVAENKTVAPADVANLVSGETFLQRAKAEFDEGESLMKGAQQTFQHDLNPLGSPPEAPKSWHEVNAMAMRVRSRLAATGEHASDAKRLARAHGVALLQAPQPSTGGVVDPYGTKQEDKLLDFLSKY